MNGNINGTLKVITVEDSSVVSERLKVMLNDISGINFRGNTTNITDAERFIASEKPDVVILDIHLKENAPHRSGIDLLAAVRPLYPHMTIIIFSNLTIQQYRDKCLSLGANYFFDKSTDFDLVQLTLKDILNPHKQ